MIIDKIENASLYTGISERIKTALDYIQNTDFSIMGNGNYEIEGDTIFALINEYKTKNANESFLEGHRDYIDVQYIVEGFEQVGVVMLDGQKAIKEYDANDDFVLFTEKHSLVSLKKDMFVIFFPDDLHMPGLKIGKPALVKKVVVKVKI
jgi:YhcH/YjgK/YiaL family protein